MIALAASIVAAAMPPAMSCAELRSEADQLQAQMDSMVGGAVDAQLATMRARHQQRAAERASSAIASLVPLIGGYIADGITMAREARQQGLERRSDQLMEEVVDQGPQLGRRLGDLETAYEMQCRRPAAAPAREARP